MPVTVPLLATRLRPASRRCSDALSQLAGRSSTACTRQRLALTPPALFCRVPARDAVPRHHARQRQRRLVIRPAQVSVRVTVVLGSKQLVAGLLPVAGSEHHLGGWADGHLAAFSFCNCSVCQPDCVKTSCTRVSTAKTSSSSSGVNRATPRPSIYRVRPTRGARSIIFVIWRTAQRVNMISVSAFFTA